MSKILLNGQGVDTGVFQESPCHGIIESQAHARNIYPLIYSLQLSESFTFLTDSLFAPISFPANPPFFPGLGAGQTAIITTPSVGILASINPGFDTGNKGDLGSEIELPNRFPVEVVGGNWAGAAQSNLPRYSPYFSFDSENGTGAVYGWITGRGGSYRVLDHTWYRPGTYSGTFRLIDFFGTAPFTSSNGKLFYTTGISLGWLAKMKLGQNIITANIASGFSGPGITSNTSIGTLAQGNLEWTANFNLKIPAMFQYSATYSGCDGRGSGSPPSGGGTLLVNIGF